LAAIGPNGRLLFPVHNLRFFTGAVMKLTRAILFMLSAAFILVFCAVALTVGGQKTASVQDAEQFMNNAESRVAEISVKVNRADWVHSNFITEDTEALAAETNDELTAVTTDLVEQAKQFDGLQMPPALARKFMLLRLSLTAPAPQDPKLRRELTKIATSLEGDYGKGKYCRKPKECFDITAIESLMANNRDPNELKDLWTGWHAVGPPMRQRYARFVELSNQGAREIGFKDTGAMWRSNYDMAPEQFSLDVEHLWNQVRPLYLSLHTFVRAKLAQHYGAALVPPNGPIPADLLGNPWAQEWGNIFPLLGLPESSQGYDLTELLKKKNVDARGMVKYGEGFFTSMGFAPLPPTFWERSLFTKPADREVVCHASAWDIDNKDDLRIKVCLQIRGDDFVTVHHELGHNFYQRAYKDQPPLFASGANDGFHEAIGDAIALAITPEYLHQVGLLENIPPGNNDTPQLLRQALDRVAFLPFGLLIDQWRWKVFSGEITPANYNTAWWDLRLNYQGVAPPMARSEADFDPGAKYHVAANVPYTRYFLAHILEFQFYRALCHEAGYTGPLHRCTFFGSKAAGARFNKMLEMGQSQPWPDELEVLTGERQIDAGALLEYFAPLKQWLDEQNKGLKLGW
jgi:peptidyl-dipeptidase A